MIQIRFPDGVDPAECLPEVAAVNVTDDARVIAIESEKNGDEQFAVVNDVILPKYRELWAERAQLFSIVSVETRSGCNATCSFCPVSRGADPRPPGHMPWQTLRVIGDGLADLEFNGRIALFGNNEPLLDERIVRIVDYFRRTVPHADLRLLTNGTLLSPALALELFEAGLSTLTVNNYTDGYRLIRPVRELLAASRQFWPYDLRVSVRRQTEVLTTRGGLAPNKPIPDPTPHGFCALPFTDLHIAYTGDVNLCCFDAHGRVSMGNVAVASLAEIWASDRFKRYREALFRGERSALNVCRSCDFDGFRQPVEPGTQSPARSTVAAAT